MVIGEALSGGSPPGFFTGCKRRAKKAGVPDEVLDASRTSAYYRFLIILDPYNSGADERMIGKVIA